LRMYWSMVRTEVNAVRAVAMLTVSLCCEHPVNVSIPLNVLSYWELWQVHSLIKAVRPFPGALVS
jgi:hypothetical protein